MFGKRTHTERRGEVDVSPLRPAEEGCCLVDLGRHIQRCNAPVHEYDRIDLHVYEVEVNVQLE